MLGKHKFSKGQRVKPSEEGYEATVLYRTGHWAVSEGTVTSVTAQNSPTVLWDGRKTKSSYHPDFIEPV